MHSQTDLYIISYEVKGRYFEVHDIWDKFERWLEIIYDAGLLGVESSRLGDSMCQSGCSEIKKKKKKIPVAFWRVCERGQSLEALKPDQNNG